MPSQSGTLRAVPSFGTSWSSSLPVLPTVPVECTLSAVREGRDEFLEILLG
jgi:hypothetical protein